MHLPDAGAALRLSVQVGLACAVLGLPIAVPLGRLLARGRFRGKSLLGTLLLAPMVLPPVVTGYLLLSLFGSARPLGAWLESIGLPVAFGFAGAVLAALVVSLPLFVMSARGAFEAVDPRLEELAWTLGETPRRTFWTVALPLALPGIAAGAVLAFARALGEFGATIVLAGNIEGRTRTLSLAVYSLLEAPGGEAAARPLLLASLALALGSLLAYEALSRWQTRRLER